jgi:hypothetical protein
MEAFCAEAAGMSSGGSRQLVRRVQASGAKGAGDWCIAISHAVPHPHAFGAAATRIRSLAVSHSVRHHQPSGAED